MLQNLTPAAVVIGALRVNSYRNGMVERMNVVSTTTKITKLAKFVGQMCNLEMSIYLYANKLQQTTFLDSK